jgi:hypothetical protein
LPDELLGELEDNEEENETEIEDKQICKAYIVYEKFSNSYYWVTSITIIIYNALFYMFTEPIIGMIGYHLKTDQTVITSFTIFVCLTVDMVLLPFFIGMNFVEYGSSKYLPVFIVGKHTDFGANFYTDVGF